MNEEPDDIDGADDVVTPASPEERGDVLPAADGAAAEGKDGAGQERDEQGRFKAKADGAADGGAADEGEDAGEDAGEGEGEGEDEGGGKPTSKHVPYDRFKQVVDQRKAAEARAAEAERRLNATAPGAAAAADTPSTEEILDELYEQVEEARADGETKLAAQLQRKIDALNREASTALATKQALTIARDREDADMHDRMVDYLTATTPIVDPDSPEYNEAVTDEINFQVRAYVGAGMRRPAALRKAAMLVFGRDMFASSEAGAADKPQKPAAPQKKKTDIAKNIDAANRIPASATKGGGDTPARINVADLSDDEFEALPESKKRELRGDVLA